MDKRRKPLTPEEQLVLRQEMEKLVESHPEWTLPEALKQIRVTLRLTQREMARVGKITTLTLQKIESAFNHVWHIERTRGLGQRFSSYLSVVLVGPVLVFGALAITATVMNNRLVQWLIGIEPFGTLVLETSRLVPYLLIVGAFTFFYTFIPNTRVKLTAALGGGSLEEAFLRATL